MNNIEYTDYSFNYDWRLKRKIIEMLFENNMKSQ